MSYNEFHTTECSCARADRTPRTGRPERGGHPHRDGRGPRPERGGHPHGDGQGDGRGPRPERHAHSVHRGFDARRRRMKQMMRLQRAYERGFAAGYTQGQTAA